MSETVQCPFCPDYLPKPKPRNDDKILGPASDDFDDVYSNHMERHENLMFGCKVQSCHACHDFAILYILVLLFHLRLGLSP